MAERKLATIETIESLAPIENADAIEVATVRGWQVVVKKGEFSVGDSCVYFEIDSFLPDREPYEFLRRTCLRTLPDGTGGLLIKTIKLKGQVSQGLVLPLGIFPDSITNKPQGTDVTEALGVTKWEAPTNLSLGGNTKGNFPSFLSKTDEERIQNLKGVYHKLTSKSYTVTEKLDGTSFTAYYHNGEFGVCSRNQELKESEGNVYWNVARKYKVEQFLQSLPFEACVQGEIIGEGIQGNSYRLQGHGLYVFNLINLETGERLDIFGDSFKFLQGWGLKTVPCLGRRKSLPADFDELIRQADGKSRLTPQANREGLVYRNYEGGYTSFKVISNKWLLKQKD